MRPLHRLPVLVLCLAAALGFQACGAAKVDLAKDIKATQVTTGWFDAGIVDGKNKLVPSASFSITNHSGSKLSGLQIFSVFRLVGDTEELGSSLIVLRGDEALAPNGTSKPVTVRAHWGFTGEQPRTQMLMHREFRDAHIEIFAKFGAEAYVKIADAPITRQLLTN
jgi:hypothetical protein